MRSIVFFLDDKNKLGTVGWAKTAPVICIRALPTAGAIIINSYSSISLPGRVPV